MLKSTYAHTSENVRAYRQPSRTFNTTRGVRQGCSISPFLFNFVIDDIRHRTMDKQITPVIKVLETRTSFDLKHADAIVCSLDSFEEARDTLNVLNLAPSKCKVMLTD